MSLLDIGTVSAPYLKAPYQLASYTPHISPQVQADLIEKFLGRKEVREHIRQHLYIPVAALIVSSLKVNISTSLWRKTDSNSSAGITEQDQATYHILKPRTG